MASFPGYSLEDFADDIILARDPVQHARDAAEYVRTHEPIRDWIENRLEDFDEGTQSWRDYRDALARDAEEELKRS